MCQHTQTETVEYERFYRDEGGPEFEVVSVAYCLDCGEVVPDVLEDDSESENIPY